MNNKGWGLAEMLILSSILIIALLVASINTKKLDNNIANNKKYMNETEQNQQEEIKTNNETNIINNNTTNNEDNTKIDLTQYKNIESKMIINAQGFVNNGRVIVGQDIIIVKDEHLYEQDDELKNKMNTNNCKGYIKIYNENNTVYYTPYINCDKYTTDGYENLYN